MNMSMNGNTFTWLLRREAWETRAMWIAPAITAVICILIAIVVRVQFGAAAAQFDGETQEVAKDVAKLHAFGAASINILAMAFVITALFTQFFYALDALYADRRDRSVLFWKSLPVSDLETVLSKYFIAAVAIPVIAIAFALVTHPIFFGVLTIGLPGAASDVATHAVFSPHAWVNGAGLLLWLTFASVLWYLPWIGWLLAVSSFAPSRPIMWALLPPAAIVLLEAGIFRSTQFLEMVGDRVGPGGLFVVSLDRAVNAGSRGSLSVTIDSDGAQVPANLLEMAAPAQFFAAPGLWIGVAVAVAFAIAAVWARRYRDETT